jgi:ABC-type nickel/cobalt efflux system permease component RcnA
VFGLDQYVAGLSDGGSLLVVIGVAIVLGLRHATDPDHLAAVTALVAGRRERTTRAAATLGLSWGLGHATTLFAFGLPIILFKAYLPERVQRGAETVIGLVIIALAVWLLVRWRNGVFHVHVHDHDEDVHAHVHAHAEPDAHAHEYAPRVRTRLQAYGIGLVHGLGGSAGVGVLLLATISDHAVAVMAMALFAAFTAVSMAAASVGFGATLSSARVRNSFHRIVPVIGAVSLVFGAWYALGALELAPYYF